MRITIAIMTFLVVAAFTGCKKVMDVTCTNKMQELKLDKMEVGTSFGIKCPAGCSSGLAWGTDTYTIDSSLCRAAIHAGAIDLAKGGSATVTIVKSLPEYKGSERNGVKTSDWGSSWGDIAFTVK